MPSSTLVRALEQIDEASGEPAGTRSIATSALGGVLVGVMLALLGFALLAALVTFRSA